MRTLEATEMTLVGGGIPRWPGPGQLPTPPLTNDLLEKLRDAADMRDATRHLLNPPSYATIEADDGY